METVTMTMGVEDYISLLEDRRKVLSHRDCDINDKVWEFAMDKIRNKTVFKKSYMAPSNVVDNLVVSTDYGPVEEYESLFPNNSIDDVLKEEGIEPDVNGRYDREEAYMTLSNWITEHSDEMQTRPIFVYENWGSKYGTCIVVRLGFSL